MPLGPVRSYKTQIKQFARRRQASACLAAHSVSLPLAAFLSTARKLRKAAPSISCAAMLALISALCFAAFGRAHGSVAHQIGWACARQPSRCIARVKSHGLPFNAFSLASISPCLCRRRPLPIWARTVASTRLLRMNQSKLPFLDSRKTKWRMWHISGANVQKPGNRAFSCAINKKSCPACFISAASALRFARCATGKARRLNDRGVSGSSGRSCQSASRGVSSNAFSRAPFAARHHDRLSPPFRCADAGQGRFPYPS